MVVPVVLIKKRNGWVKSHPAAGAGRGVTSVFIMNEGLLQQQVVEGGDVAAVHHTVAVHVGAGIIAAIAAE